LSTIASRPLRADARRNREKVLAAATEAFAEAGLDAQVEDIARRASVGVGTVYRHFPTKEALVDALAMEHFDQLADIAEASEGAGDPWEDFAGAIWRCAESTAGNVALCEIVGGRPSAVQAAVAGQRRLEAASARLIDGARAQGAIRDDATVDDVRTIMCGFGHVAAAQRAGAPLDWRRYLTIALDGLRPR
jgi:AcrR family transcriptional regulator